ncbi:unnamed protein product [Pleuronectes platessa]|uniref:Fibronectin type-III domain-containing protein n=1 Tax=Pleuronectes platessa TaxID=8262 RepID=A0A9N7Y984_PLEPL|nr:unnamed protein product [Pleuronectes platessa]
MSGSVYWLVSWALDSQSFDLSGLPPVENHPVFFSEKDSDLPPSVQVTEGEGNVSLLLRLLRRYTVYELQVLGFTQLGDGPLSSPVLLRTKEDAVLHLLAPRLSAQPVSPPLHPSPSGSLQISRRDVVTMADFSGCQQPTLSQARLSGWCFQKFDCHQSGWFGSRPQTPMASY